VFRVRSYPSEQENTTRRNAGSVMLVIEAHRAGVHPREKRRAARGGAGRPFGPWKRGVLLRRRQVLRHEVPVQELVADDLEERVPVVAVVEIVGVLPDVGGQEG